MILGDDVVIDPGAKIRYPDLLVVGSHSAIDPFTYISVLLLAGDWIHIAPFVSIIGGKDSRLIMGHFATIAAGSRIVCGSDDFVNSLMGPHIPMEHRTVKLSTITLEPYSAVGTNCVVMPNVTLGEGAALGANSLATRDLEPWTIYVGSPARPLKMRNKELVLSHAHAMGY